MACGLDSDDRMVRRYAKCLTDTNTTLHRLNASSASGAVTLSAEAAAERLRGQVERGSSPWRRSGPTTPATVNRNVGELREERGRKAHGRAQSGIKNGLEGLDALRRVMATEYVAWGMNRVGWMTNRVWIMRYIRNREGSKRADEIRHLASARNPRTERFT